MKKFLSITVAIALTSFFISCGGETKSQQQTKPEDSTKTVQPPKDADQLSFTVKDLDGVIRNSSEWVGKKPLVINIWGTWCPPCRAEIPAFVKAYDIYSKKGVEFLGIAVKDSPDKVDKFATANNMKWVMMLFSSAELVERFKIEAVPTTIFVDRNGKVMKIYNPRTKTYTESFSGAMHYDQFVGYLDTLVSI